MSNNKIDIISLIATKFGDKVQIQPGHLSTGTIIANNGLHRDVLKAMIDADEKTGITAITGLDLGANIRRLLPRAYIQRFFNNKS